MTAPALLWSQLAVQRQGVRILHDCTGEAPAAAFTAIIGPNGSGKSTLIAALCSALPLTAGRIEAGGVDISTISRRERARRIALVEQQADATPDLTVEQVVLLGRHPHASPFSGPGRDDLQVVDAAIARAGADALRGRRYPSLSGGERQRVHVARALAQQPQVLILDEPTNHLDVNAQLDIAHTLQTLAGSGVAVIAAIHDLTLAAAYADRVIAVDAGRVIAQGEPRQVLTAELVSRLYGVEAAVIDHPLTGRPLIAVSRAPVDSPRTDPRVRSAR